MSKIDKSKGDYLMKKWSLITLVLSLALFAFAGSALAAKATGGKGAAGKGKSPKTVTVVHLGKGPELGTVYVKLDSASTVQALQKGITAAGTSLTWSVVPEHKDGKVFKATFKAKLKTNYQFKAAAPFALGKGVSPKIVWNANPVKADFIFELEPGQFTLKLDKQASLADLQGKITASAAGVKYPVAISGSGKTFKASITGAKAGVAYTIAFSEPFPAMSLPYTWPKKPEPPAEEELPPIEGDVQGDVYAP